jgi:hypothetical protein
LACKFLVYFLPEVVAYLPFDIKMIDSSLLEHIKTKETFFVRDNIDEST